VRATKLNHHRHAANTLISQFIEEPVYANEELILTNEQQNELMENV
jgi:hypothetical protein